MKPKKTIILIHGLRGDHHGLLEIADSLRQKYDLLVPDLPGSGDRAELDNKTLDGYADWLHSYIEEQKLDEKPYVLGHSMGSIIVSKFIDKYPDDTCSKVILLSPIFRTKIGGAVSNIEYALLAGSLHLLPKNPRYKLMKSKFISFIISHFLTVDKKQQKRIDQLHYKYSGRFASADSLLADAKISMKSKTILPTDKKNILLCIGNKDRLTSLKLAKKTAEQSNLPLEIIADSGHLVNYERPEEVAKIVKKFIR